MFTSDEKKLLMVAPLEAEADERSQYTPHFSLWDIATQKPGSALGDAYSYRCVLAQDDRRALCGGFGYNADASLIDLTRGDSKRVMAKCFTRDRRYVIGAGSFAGPPKVYDVERGEEAALTPEQIVSAGLQGEVCLEAQYQGLTWTGGLNQRMKNAVWECSDSTNASALAAMQYTPDGKTLVVACGKQLMAIDVQSEQVVARRPFPHGGEASEIVFAAGTNEALAGASEVLQTVGHDGVTRLRRLPQLEPLGRVIAAGLDYVVSNEDGYYLSSAGANALVAFSDGKRAYPFEDLDLYLNRPDVILKTSNPNAASLYARAYEKRLKRLGLSAAPQLQKRPSVALTELPPATTHQPLLNLHLLARSAAAPLRTLKVRASGVVIQEQAIEAATPQIALSTQLSLVPGKNLVAVSVVDREGNESLQAQATITYLASTPQKPTLFVLAIGVSDYTLDALDLSYAAKDAQDVAAALSEANGPPSKTYAARLPRWRLEQLKRPFASVRTQVLVNADVTKENIALAQRFLAEARAEDQVVLFMAGHGVLDGQDNYWFATSDIDPAAPEQRGVAFDAIETMLSELTARSRVVLIDTCHSGSVDRDEEQKLQRLPEGVSASRGVVRKGARSSHETSRFIGEVFAQLKQNSGATVLTSSSGVQFSLESSAFKNGVFTAAVLEAMRNEQSDADQSGVVELTELQSYVRARVSALTSGLQTPTLRTQNFAANLSLFPAPIPGFGEAAQAPLAPKKKTPSARERKKKN